MKSFNGLFSNKFIDKQWSLRKRLLILHSKKQILLSLLVGLVSISISANQPASSEAKILPYQWQQIDPVVRVAVKPAPHRIVDSNITVIEADDCLVIIDANDNLDNADQLTRDIRAFSSKPVCYVVNTHWHSDHILANSVYAQAFPQIKAFVGHQNLPELIETRAKPQLQEKIKEWSDAIEQAQQKLQQSSDDPLLATKIAKAEKFLSRLKQTELIKPTLTVQHSLELPVKGLTIQLLHFGAAHTEGDLVVFLPAQKLLIAGDLFDHLPYAGHGFPQQWKSALTQIEQLAFERVVPGHGAIQTGKQELHLIAALLEQSIAAAKRAVDNHLDQQSWLDSLDWSAIRAPFEPLDELGGRVFKQFIPEFYARAYWQWEQVQSKVEEPQQSDKD